MKKILYTLAAGVMTLSLAACGANGDTKSAEKENKAKTAESSGQQDQTKQQKEQQQQAEAMQKKMEKQKVDDKKTVALVNGKAILGSDYNTALSSTQMQMQQMGQDPTSDEAAKQVKDQTIESLVGQTLLLQEADKKGYKASKTEITKQMEQLKQQYKGQDKLEAAMKQQGMDMKKLNQQMADSIKFTKYMDKEVHAEKVTDEEIKKYYDQYSQQAQGQKLPKLEEVKPQIQQQIQQQKKQEKLSQIVEGLKKNAKIEVKI
ncbi:SurA N-terminal domain-containing protein [Metabacillus sp. GX 13764]|uniref:SurA N-terminal domain-containing protein n=1 Tax=Metabacillus kandeliae TaxID=2900151 RepID=UPI001E5D4E47|nr:SurA N-terminal domain-containing protein [Metabacillus kandeliae]MCD7035515.1 SurA N-terminal domain-containing protein [Metabacillus kandeliae]